MTNSQIIEVMQAAMVVAFKIGLPILILSMIIGLIISIFQAATQVHEQTLTFVPKLIITAVMLIALGPWMLETLADFTRYIFGLMLTFY